MSEALSAMQGAFAKGAVTVQDIGPQGMITLRGDLTDAKLAAAVQDVAGTAIPAQRRVETAGERTVAWMSPDELLILLPYADANPAVARLSSALAGTHALAANVSDARALFRLSGKPAQVREVMAKLAPADLSPDAFGPGDFRRTRLSQIAAAFWMPTPDSFHVVCFRSVAQYAFDLLKTSAQDGPVGFFR